MILNVSVTEYRPLVSSYEIGLARDSHTVSRLRARYAPLWFSSHNSWTWHADLAAGRGSQHYVDKYSEVTTEAPWNDVVLFFNRMSLLGGTRVPTGPLYYPARYPLLNGAAMANAAEALAGWFCEDHYNWALITRPPRVTPDLHSTPVVEAR